MTNDNQRLIIVRHYILIALQKKSMQNIDFLAKYYQKTNKLSKYRLLRENYRFFEYYEAVKLILITA